MSAVIVFCIVVFLLCENPPTGDASVPMTARVKELTKRAKGGVNRPPTQPAGGVQGFLDAFARLGYDVEDLLAAAGLRATDLEDPDALLPCSTIADIYARSQQRRPMRNISLHLALETPVGAYPLLDYLVLSSDTVGAGFRQLARYLVLVGSPIVFTFDDESDPVRAALSCPGNLFLIEFTIALSVLHLRRETDGRLAVASLHFARRPDDPSEFERELKCSVRVGEGWDGILLPKSSWGLELRRRDPVLRALLERQTGDATGHLRPASDTASRLRRLLASRITGGDTRIQTTARQMATTPRTLQRRLAAAGTNYQDVLEEIRRDAALGYLADSDLSAGEVGYLLGYSEPAAFHRAFRRWQGVTPLEYRRSRREIRAGAKRGPPRDARNLPK